MAMEKIISHLWFDKEAKEAAEFYASVFPHSRVTHLTTLKNTPSGDTDVVSFELWNQKFMAISAGPLFKFNPAISFLVNFDPLLFDPSPEPEKDARKKIDLVWSRLTEGGNVLMPLDKYPFSERYGWVQDRYGLSWQLILTDAKGDRRPPIVPSLLFVRNKYGKAEEAIHFYLSVFKNSKLGGIHRYGQGREPDKEGTIMFADFMIENKWFAAMDSGHEHKFDFNEAISFMVQCKDQSEIDYYWEKLSAVSTSEQCGWLKDKYGISWQITPIEMEEMLSQGGRQQIDRLTQAFLPMKKLDIATLKKAYEAK
jgi:predicted 3-demethylubiquinone-9 3-methyltransferase (glyoxalase superfamily)